MRENYNGTRSWFSEKQLPLLIVVSRKTDFKKRASLKQKQKSPQIVLPEAKNKRVDSNIEMNTTYTTQVMNLNKKLVFPQI